METIYIKKQTLAEGEPAVFVVPAVGIKTEKGLKLIPHPYGTEMTHFETLDETLSQVHRAGYAADYDGKHYPPPARKSLISTKPSLKTLKGTPVSQVLRQALPRLIEQLSDSNPGVISQAAQALGEMGDEQALQGLFHCFGHEDIQVRKAAAEAVARMGKSGLSVIQTALADKNWVVRHSGLSAMIALVHTDFDRLTLILPEALATLKDDNWLVRSQGAALFTEVTRYQKAQLEKQGF